MNNKPEQAAAIFQSLPSGRYYLATADVAFKGEEGGKFAGGLEHLGDNESELIRFIQEDEMILLGPNTQVATSGSQPPSMYLLEGHPPGDVVVATFALEAAARLTRLHGHRIRREDAEKWLSKATSSPQCDPEWVAWRLDGMTDLED